MSDKYEKTLMMNHQTKTFHVSIIHGVLSLLSRQFILKIFAIAANIYLARWLGPKNFGLYAILSLIVFGPFNILGILGFNIALIQKPNPINEKDTGTTLVTQIIILVSIGFLVFILQSTVFEFYDLEKTLGPTLWWLFLALCLRTFRTIPTSLMEKELQFKVLTFIEVVESLVYYLLILFLAFHGYEIWSFIYATALKEFVGLAMLMKMSKWRFSVNFDMKTFKGLLKVGLPYQAGAVTNFLSISFPALVIGSFIGQKELGYVSWAHNISLQLIFFATVLDRLWVPTYAKIQNNLKEFLKTVKKTLRFNILTIFPLTIIFFIFAQEITRDIFGQDWVPGAYLLYFYLVACLFSAIGFPIGNAFNALGETRRTFWLSLSWAVIIWGIGMPLTLLFGLTGWGWTYISVQLPYFFMFWYFSRRFNFSIWNTVRAPLFMFFLSSFLTLLMKITLPVTAPFIWISYGVFGVISYFAGLHFIFKDGFLLELKSFWESIRVKDIF